MSIVQKVSNCKNTVAKIKNTVEDERNGMNFHGIFIIHYKSVLLVLPVILIDKSVPKCISGISFVSAETATKRSVE
jgi:hypothetical protein